MNAQKKRRVLVLGATGHLGGLVLQACQSRVDLSVGGSSRRASGELVRVDLNDATTFSSIQDYDVVINATDSGLAPPAEIARYCLEHGKIFLETSAEMKVFQSLLQLPENLPGTIVLGAGAFPGLSTHLLAVAPADAPLEFRAAWSVFSGAGAGTVDVMVNALGAPAVTFENGQYKHSPPMTPIERRSIGSKNLVVMPLSMADIAIAAETSSRPSVAFFAAVRPSLPVPMLKVVAWMAARGVYSLPPVKFGIRLWLSLLRARLFRNTTSAIRIELHTSDRMLAALNCADAFGAGAAACAILAAKWPAEISGLRLPHEGIGLPELAQELGDKVSIEFGAESAR